MVKEENVKTYKRENSLFNFIDSHLREIKWTFYGVGAVGAALLLRNVKPTSKFSCVKDIPEKFVHRHIRLQGVVRDVTRDGRLLVDHIPVYTLPRLPFKTYVPESSGFRELLPVSLAGVNPITCDEPVTPDGALTSEATINSSYLGTSEWLSQHTLHRHIWFRLMHCGPDESLLCHVHVRKRFLWSSVNKDLARLGLCTVCVDLPEPDSPTFFAYNRFIHKLIALESNASKKGIGIWKEESMTSRIKTRMSKHTAFLQEKKKVISNLLRNPFRRKKVLSSKK